MKVLNILLLFVLMAVGCKTQKIAPKPEPVKSETIVNPTPAVAPAITSKVESVTAANGEANDLGSKKFYIILGTFGVFENAQKFKKQLISEDFVPGILINDAGLFRVSVNSYDDETAARNRISEIRQKFPKYNDLWLLVKK
jgi:cell division protein FtsN